MHARASGTEGMARRAIAVTVWAGITASSYVAAAEGTTGACTLPVDAPAHVEYHRLANALQTYQEIAWRGGWPMQHEPRLLRPGDTIAPDRLARLRARLIATGDLGGGRGLAPEGRYTGDLVAAVRRFQSRHGLLVDGIVGPDTTRAMNVPAAHRVQQIALNMARWQLLPDDLGERHVRVNIPAFRLHLFDQSDDVLAMNVVVGSTSTPTPVFSDEIEYLQFRPYWNVPHRIAREELMPWARTDPASFAEQGYQVLDGWGTDAALLDPAVTEWTDEELMYRIRQLPGPDNALGRVKFMFPNTYSVYLHDTPAKHLFDRHSRAFSHGCVRVAQPAALAAALLAPRGWTEQQVHVAMDSGPRRAVRLDEPVPVHLLYNTSWVDSVGVVHFRRDVYGLDARALEGFRCAASDASVLNPLEIRHQGDSARAMRRNHSSTAT